MVSEGAHGDDYENERGLEFVELLIESVVQ